MADVLSRGRRQAALGLPVGRDAAVPGVREPVPAHGLTRSPAPTAEEGRSGSVLPDRGRRDDRHVRIVVHEGPPTGTPTRVVAQGKADTTPAGKSASARSAVTSTRRMCTRGSLKRAWRGRISWSPPTSTTGRQGVSRPPTPRSARQRMRQRRRCATSRHFGSGLPAVPDEPIPRRQHRTVRAIDLRSEDLRRPVQRPTDAGVRAAVPDRSTTWVTELHRAVD